MESCTIPFLSSAVLMSSRHSPVNRESLTDDVARRGAAKPQYRRGDLLRPTCAADGNALSCLVVHLFVAFEDVVAD